MEKLHYSRGIVTNASHNRKQAMRLFAAGFTPAEIAAEFPEVWKLSADGKLGQRYDSEYPDGTLETRYMIHSEAVDALVSSRKAH